MKIKILLLSLFLFIFSGFLSFTLAAETEMYFFWGDGCPHCSAAKPFINELEKEYPELKVTPYEIYNNEDNYNLFILMADAYGMPNNQRGVPAFFIGNEAFSGYHETMNNKFRTLIEGCINSGCPSPVTKLANKSTNAKSDSVDKMPPENSNIYSTFLFFLLVVVILGVIYYIFIKRDKK
jgi:thiol-disulfide isomerase/thioredoxin